MRKLKRTLITSALLADIWAVSGKDPYSVSSNQPHERWNNPVGRGKHLKAKRQRALAKKRKGRR